MDTKLADKRRYLIQIPQTFTAAQAKKTLCRCQSNQTQTGYKQKPMSDPPLEKINNAQVTPTYEMIYTKLLFTTPQNRANGAYLFYDRVD